MKELIAPPAVSVIWTSLLFFGCNSNQNSKKEIESQAQEPAGEATTAVSQINTHNA